MINVMRSNFAYHQLYYSFPMLTLFISCLLETIILPNFTTVIPFLGVSILFYWTLYRPWQIHPLSLLLVGLFYDLLLEGPLGGLSFIFVLLYLLIFFQRSALEKGTFHTVWLAFFFITLLTFMWKIITASEVTMLLLSRKAFDGLITLLIYPFISRFLGTLLPKRSSFS